MQKNIKLMTTTALLAAISILLSYFEIPIIPAFPFLKLDFAEVPIILSALLLGFIPTVCAEGIRSLVSLFLTGTASAGVGTAFNFVLGTIFAVLYCYLLKSRQVNIWLKMIIASLALTLIACILNFVAVVPIYKLIGMFPQNVPTEYYIWAGALPLNLVKWLTNSILAAIVAKSGVERFIKER